MVIIAGVDRSDRAEKVVEEAHSLAEAFDTDLHVVHVLTQSEFVDLERTNVEDSGRALEMDVVKDVAGEIAAEPAESLGVPYESVGLMGDPADRLVEYAANEGARYIVLGPRKRSPTGKALFGSVAQSALLNAECPVVTTI